MNWSIVLIAKNEEKTLPKLMNSLKEFQARGGQVCLCDTGSTDKTVEVAKSFGMEVTEVGERFITVIDEEKAKQINERFIIENEQAIVKAGDRLFDYSAARNFAVTLSKNDMVSMPDCDEEFTKLDLDKVKALIESGVEQIEYNFVFSHDAFGNEAVKFLHSKFYNRTKQHWVGIVHEVLQGEARRQWVDESVIKLEHWQQPSEHRSRYLTGLALDCFLNPDNDRNSHYLARELMWTGRPKSAIKEFERHIAMNRWQPEKSQSMVFMGDCQMMLKNDALAIESWQKAFTIEASRREPLIRLAEYYFQQHDAQRTASYVAAALEIGNNNFYANQQAHYTNHPHELMYWATWMLGRKEQSKEHFEKAFAYQPLNGKYLHDIRFFESLPTVSIIVPQLGRPEGLQRLLESIKRLNYPSELIDVKIIEGDETVPVKVKRGVEETKGEYICYAANDLEFEPNSLILAVLASRKNNKALVAFHEGPVLPDKGNICTHFILRRDLISKIGGEVFCTRMNHCGVDNLLWAKCDKLNEALHCNEAIIIHKHFSTKSAPMDEIYQKGWSKMEQDRQILAEELAKLYVQAV